MTIKSYRDKRQEKQRMYSVSEGLGRVGKLKQSKEVRKTFLVRYARGPNTPKLMFSMLTYTILSTSDQSNKEIILF